MAAFGVGLSSYPEGVVTKDHFQTLPLSSLEEAIAACPDGSYVLKPLYLSVDPYMRGRMRNQAGYFFPPFEIGKPCVGGGVGEVVASKSAKYPVGATVSGMMPWASHSTHADTDSSMTVVPAIPGLSWSRYLGVIGMPGVTAYFGLLDITDPKEGETLVVSGAAGAVGQLVCQIGKIKGMRVIGIAGSADKCEVLRSKCGCDVAINYKDHPTLESMSAALKAAAPDGVDVYFDNTGGHISDAVTLALRRRGRVSVCGQISTYNATDISKELGPRLDFVLVTREIKKEGFLVTRWAARWMEAVKQLGEWVGAGRLHADEHVVEGLAHIGDAFIDMMAGANTGKMVVKC